MEAKYYQVGDYKLVVKETEKQSISVGFYKTQAEIALKPKHWYHPTDGAGFGELHPISKESFERIYKLVLYRLKF